MDEVNDDVFDMMGNAIGKTRSKFCLGDHLNAYAELPILGET
jgi:hypothetical protein